MKDSLSEFNNQVEQIKTHINVLEKYSELIKVQSNADVDYIKTNSTEERVFNYRSNIISLYGAFEQFLENIIKEYFKAVQIYYISFEEWEDVVTKNYIELWKKLHGKLSYTKYNSITQDSMVENLNDVVRNHKSTLIPECYLQNGGNYKSTTISNMFNDIGIVNINDILVKYEPFQTFLIDQNPDSQFLESTKKRELYYQKLDELVEFRNEVAHGARPSQIINNDIFLEMLSYISCYAEAMNSFLTDKVFEKQWQSIKTKAIKISHIYREGKVALLNNEEMKGSGIDSFAVGDSLLVNFKESDCSRFFIAEINEIRVDLKNGEKEKKVDKVDVNEEIEEVSIGVSEKVKSGQKIKLIKNRLNVL